jgi:hypothetical protein
LSKIFAIYGINLYFITRIHFFGTNVQLYVLPKCRLDVEICDKLVTSIFEKINILCTTNILTNVNWINLPLNVFDDGNAKKFTPMGLCKMLKAKWQ